jgi:phage shock protein A
MSEPHKEIVGRLQAESAAHKYRESSPHLTALLDDATEAVSRAERKIAELEAENRRLREALDPDTLEAAAPSAISSSPAPETLKAILSALSEGLGDTDITHIEHEDELRREEPVQWAAMKLAQLLEASR